MYTYETGETIALSIVVSWLGEVKFYSPVHGYFITNFNNHIKSVINVLRMLFDLIDSNKEDMIKYYYIEAEEPEEPEETEETVKDVMEVKQALNAECGLWPSANEVSTGYHKSRRYNQLTIRY